MLTGNSNSLTIAFYEIKMLEIANNRTVFLRLFLGVHHNLLSLSRMKQILTALQP